MTDKPIIDEKFLNHLADELETIRKNIKTDIDDLRDKECDIFERYTAYCRAKSIIKTFEFLAAIGDFLLKDGHTLNNEYFKTESYIDNGWNNDHLAENDFFETNDDVIMERIERMIAIKKKLKEKNTSNE